MCKLVASVYSRAPREKVCGGHGGHFLLKVKRHLFPASCLDEFVVLWEGRGILSSCISTSGAQTSRILRCDPLRK